MNYTLSLLAFILTLGGLSVDHEFHVSKCVIEYKADKSEIQVSMNIFIDDLESALQNMGVDSLYIGTEKESLEADTYITRYLNESFIVRINENNDVDQHFIGKEISEDLTSIWCYFQINANEPIYSLFVKNSILLETFDDQSNITRIIGPAQKKSNFMSTRGDDEKNISY